MTYLPTKDTFLLASSELTRPANTTAYAIGQIIGDTGAAALSFSSMLQSGVSAGQALFAKLDKSTTSTTNAAFRLYLFNADPGTTTDQTTFAPTYANLSKSIGWIDFVNAVVGSDRVEFTGVLSQPNLLFAIASGTTLYGQAVAVAAYTPASGEKFTFTIGTLS